MVGLAMPPAAPPAAPSVPTWFKFASAGGGGIVAWWCVHPFNTLAVRMNLAMADPSAPKLNFPKFAAENIRAKGFRALYDGIGAGTLRQVFYATSRFGLFEVFRDRIGQIRGNVGPAERTVAGLSSGACAAIISCPAEVSLVRMSNDSSLPADKRRGYKSVFDCAKRILNEEGPRAFWRGSMPFVYRAMLVGVTQVGTLDQFKEMYETHAGIQRGTYFNVFCASMSSGLLYSLITMPFESAKNRMAFQKPDANGVLPYRGTLQTLRTVAATEGALSLWTGFLPYYGRCGSHTVLMFIFVDVIRNAYMGKV